jgi:hypothetical protein
MTQPEARLQRKIQDALRDLGAFVFKVHGGPTMMAGLPDLIVCYRGWFIGMEVKMPERRDNVSPIQLHVHEKIRAAQGEACVVTSVAEALSELERLDRLMSEGSP